MNRQAKNKKFDGAAELSLIQRAILRIGHIASVVCIAAVAVAISTLSIAIAAWHSNDVIDIEYQLLAVAIPLFTAPLLAHSFIQLVFRLHKLQLQLAELANTDALTGLFNRRFFFCAAEMEFARALRHSRSTSVLMVDIDNFKSVNDTLGHQVGDKVLKEISAACLQSTRAGDVLARYGGEEFVLLLPETDHRGAQAMAARICRVIESCIIELDHRQLSVTASIGFAATNSKAKMSFAELLSCADKAVYVAKHAGKNCFRTCDETCAMHSAPAIELVTRTPVITGC